MKTIKTRNVVKDIKVIDKSANLATHMKDGFIRTKEKAEETQGTNHSTPADYAVDKVKTTAKNAVHEVVHNFPNPKQKASGNWSRAKGHFEEVKSQMPNELKRTAEEAKKTAKTAKINAGKLEKTAQKSAQAAAKAAKAAAQTAKVTTKVAIQTAKAATKVTISMVKAAIAAIKGLVALIAAGGWAAVAIILIICLIGLLVGSVYGIFFSSEPDSHSGKTVNTVISEIDTEYTDKIDNIISSKTHDLLDMSGAWAAWKKVLSVYKIKTVTDPDNPMEVATMNDEKAVILNTVFWDMNNISHTTGTTTVYENILNASGLPTGSTRAVTKTVLRINVTHKTTDEMAIEYGFNDEQKEMLAELLKPDYHNLWNSLLYGITSIGDGTMIEIAATQIGNIGGQPYWSWYGFGSREAWCACFVSWVADQCGYIDAGIIPRFALCDTGITWFKTRSQWQYRTYTPAPGDLIFFDWNGNEISDHVGIVEYVEGTTVHTIEGNTSNSCARRTYQLTSTTIMGYGVTLY